MGWGANAKAVLGLTRTRRALLVASAALALFPAGSSARLSADFNGDRRDDLAIGVPGEDLAGAANDDEGAVHLLLGGDAGVSFNRNRFLTEATRGIAGAPEAGDSFGATLAAGDFDGDRRFDLAIAVPNEDVPAGDNNSDGAVHVLYGARRGLSTRGDQLFTQARDGLRGDGPEAFDHFGSTLAAGDFDGDGHDDLAIGVPDENIPSDPDVREGAVHVLFGARRGLTTRGDQLLHQGIEGIAGDGPESQDIFGSHLASGDFDGDGKDDLVASAHLEDVAAGANDNDGAVHVLRGSRRGITTRRDRFITQETPGILGEGAEAGDVFGTAVAAGDLNGDGGDDLVVGVAFEDVGGSGGDREGIVQVLPGGDEGVTTDGDQLITQGTVGIAGGGGPELGDRFGFSLTTGDVNGDRFGDLAVTALFEDITGAGAGQHGAVHVFPGGPALLSTLGGAFDDLFFHQDTPGVEGGAEAGDRFGETLSAGRFDQGRRADLVVGVPQEDLGSGGNDGDGVAHVFPGSATGLALSLDLLVTQDSAGIAGDGAEANDSFAGSLLP